MYAVVGLGNPGKKYAVSFHNAGFWALDELSSIVNAQVSEISDFKSQIAICFIESYKVVLAKPTTYMNLSGIAVAAILQFYKISVEDLIVIRDDIDMELGKIKLKKNSSSGGHKGVQSIIDALGSKAFIQLKIGVGRKDNVSDFVLKKLTDEEKMILGKSAKIAALATIQIITEGFEKTANNYNGRFALDV
jgi:PTH1 family peptidyl-tRNA hydrolase